MGNTFGGDKVLRPTPTRNFHMKSELSSVSLNKPFMQIKGVQCNNDIGSGIVKQNVVSIVQKSKLEPKHNPHPKFSWKPHVREIR
mmetsp:Transcript_13114/g.28219  ORF Transcript_13114/g.28219 Transcript_13114/m.28219 type:complete len:85 (-) Transcript_13114:1646-1900(-)